MMTAAMNDRGSQPLYVWLRECLRTDITAGKYPAGSLLPSEIELSKAYGVSRHTVREATRKLADSGLISRRAGVGTVVRAETRPSRYAAGLGTMQEVRDFINTTRLENLSMTAMKADAEMAARLECEPGSEWLEINAIRHVVGQTTPIATAHLFLRAEFRRIKDRLRGFHPNVYDLIQNEFGEEIVTVRQEIEALLMPPATAKLLGAKPRSPALLQRRFYIGKNNRLLAVSSNTFAADRFRMVTSWPNGGKKNRASERRAAKKLTDP